MAINKERKAEIIKKFQKADLDTGSSEVQIALLTERIVQLTSHFQIYKKDVHGRRGLLTLVNQRRRLLDYLASKDLASYQKVIKELEIRK